MIPAVAVCESLDMNADDLYARPRSQVTRFCFDEQVARVFDDMLQRSVPLYAESLRRQAQLAAHFYQPHSRIYDLGCSHGNFIAAFCAEMAQRPFQLQAVDPAEAMLQRCRQRLRELALAPQQQVELLACPAQQLHFAPASVVVINLTLQFLPLAEREPLLRRIYQALVPGGLLLLTEKIEHEQAPLAELERDWYYRFKAENGYSQLEISQKREALEQVLIPESCQEHEQRLRRCGFGQIALWLKWFNFAGFLCLK